jgi:putative membrane protein
VVAPAGARQTSEVNDPQGQPFRSRAFRQPARQLIPPDPRKKGSDPDYRFTLANERTFLAWIRTSLALAAGGLAAASLLDDFPGEQLLGLGLLILSFVTASLSYRRWALSETAIRQDQPLPRSPLPLVLAMGVAIIVVASAILVAVHA